MERTLYLNEAGTNISVMRDGPSLWVKEEGSSGRRLPVRLLDMVVLIHNVKIDADSLMLLSKNRIPVLLLDRRGEKVAYVLPYERKIPARYRDQKFILRYERCQFRYRNWAQAKRLLIASSALRRILKDSYRSCQLLGEGNYEEILRELIQKLRVSRDVWNSVRMMVSTLFEGLIIKRLIVWGFHIHTGIINKNKNFGLVQDLAYILGGEIDSQTFQFFDCGEPRGKVFLSNSGQWEVAPSAVREIVHRFENRKKAILGIIEDTINELCELIREMRL